jgi:magnesium-transporting ATPase (P-type)
LAQNKMRVAHLFWDTHDIHEVPLQPKKGQDETGFQMIRRLSVEALNTAHRLSIESGSIVRTLSTGNIHQLQRLPSLCDDNEKTNIWNVTSEAKSQAFQDLLLGAALCNNAEKQMVQDKQVEHDISTMNSESCTVGDAVDTALYSLCADRCTIDIDTVRKINPRLKVFPFNLSNKFMISANQLQSNDPSISESERTVLIIMKGESDIVIERCSSYKNNKDEILPFNTEMKKTMFNRHEELGKADNIEL